MKKRFIKETRQNGATWFLTQELIGKTWMYVSESISHNYDYALGQYLAYGPQAIEIQDTEILREDEI